MTFVGLGGFVIAGTLYTLVLYALVSRYDISASKAVVAGLAMLLCEAVWEPETFTTAERLLIVLPLCLNSVLSWTIFSTQGTSSASLEHGKAIGNSPGSKSEIAH